MSNEERIFNELIDTVLKNSKNNIATISDVNLWVNSWKK